MENICYGCMNNIVDSDKICSNCDYENTSKEDSFTLNPGTLLTEKYLVGKVIGYGGFSIVYIGYDLVNKKKVAIKEYFPKKYCSRIIKKNDVYIFEKNKELYNKGLKRFYYEADILNKHSNLLGIVTFYDFLKLNKTLYIVMEYIDGITLEEYIIESGGILKEEISISIILKLISTIEVIHSNGFIHGDISPENIFITTDGEIKLIDFATIININMNNGKEFIIIKDGYAPEEKYRKNSKIGIYSDVYSISATLYRMVVGEVLICVFDRTHGMVLNFKGSELSKSLKRTLNIGLELKKEDRFENIEKFRASLIGKNKIINFKRIKKTIIIKINKVIRNFKYIIPFFMIILFLLVIFDKNKKKII